MIYRSRFKNIENTLKEKKVCFREATVARSEEEAVRRHTTHFVGDRARRSKYVREWVYVCTEVTLMKNS